MQGFFETIENGIHYRYIHLESGLWKKIQFDEIVQNNLSLKNAQKPSKKKKNQINNTYFDSLLEENKQKPTKKKQKQLTNGQLWWRSLTLEQQAQWRYNLMLKKKGKADYQFELEQCKKDNLYRKS